MTLGMNTARGGGFFQRNLDAQVPLAKPYAMGMGEDDGLHTPHQNVPMPGVGSFGAAMRTSMGPPTSRNEWTSYGFGRYGARNLSEWNREDEMYFDPSRPKEMALGFSRDDVEYAKMSERKNRELLSGMSERQKRLLKALEGGKLFKLSKLVPC